MVGQISIHSTRKRQFFLRQLKILAQNLKRVVSAAVGTPAEDAVNGETQRTFVAGDFGLKFLLPIATDRMLAIPCHFHAKANSESALRFVVEFERLQVLMNSVGNPPYGDRFCILNLLRREEGVVLAGMSAIRAMARRWAFNPGSWRDFGNRRRATASGDPVGGVARCPPIPIYRACHPAILDHRGRRLTPATLLPPPSMRGFTPPVTVPGCNSSPSRSARD